jgi:anti-anti-sigma factor
MHNAIEIEMASPSIVIISLIGECDVAHYESLKAALARAAIRAPNVLVDLSQCALLDCAALGLLLDSQNVVTRDGGRFGIALPNEPNAVTRAAGLVHLSERAPTFASVPVALASFQQDEFVAIRRQSPAARWVGLRTQIDAPADA